MFPRMVDEKIYLSQNILNKVISIQDSLLRYNKSLIEIYSSLRYLLETLIQTELILKEPQYTYILFYSIYNHQCEKGEKFIQRIEKEIEIMKNYDIEDQKIARKFSQTIKCGNDPKMAGQLNKVEQDALDEKADLEFTMFCGDFRYFGYGLTMSFLMNEVLPEYQRRLSHFEHSRIQKAKDLLNQDQIAKYFDFRKQHSRVFKELKDTRTWKEKASAVGLDKEYNLIYDLTSAILHATSYSFITSKDTSKLEIEMVLTYCLNYTKKIMNNIRSFTPIEFLNNIKMFKLE